MRKKHSGRSKAYWRISCTVSRKVSCKSEKERVERREGEIQKGGGGIKVAIAVKFEMNC